nr:hypothetical protein BaRGS_001040 [Batillaria attramentaria]
MDGLNVYQNEDEVYASFKASRPELDNVQRYLVDRLASGELPYIFADLTTGSEYPRNVSNLDVNYKKNRFASIQPCIGREEREVVQYHYVSWPDHGAPDPTSLIVFWRFVTARTAHNPNVPLLVHCRNNSCFRDTFKPAGEFVNTFPQPVNVFSPHSHIGKEFKGEATSRDVRVLRYENWTGEVPASTTDLHLLVDALDKGRTDSVGPPVIVQCSARPAAQSAQCTLGACEQKIHPASVRARCRHSACAEAFRVQYRCLYDLAQRQAGEMAVYANA